MSSQRGDAGHPGHARARREPVFACIWYYLGADDFSEEVPDGGRRRAPARGCSARAPSAPGNPSYITACTSVMTLSTVGYGDISPNTTEEKIFTIVVIFTGVSGYAMLIQAIGTAMAGDPNKLSHTKAMRNYLYDYEVPPDLAKRILHFLRLRDKKMRQEYIEPEVDLCIETLSKSLRRRLVLHTRRTRRAVPGSSKPMKLSPTCLCSAGRRVAPRGCRCHGRLCLGAGLCREGRPGCLRARFKDAKMCDAEHHQAWLE